ncbi:hypothetical protein M2459_002530 [Parabacteroides sp. PF5-5]|uniref:DUF6340 family protein n=1 Tax=unclassified Parabacteroides TaxID=2649774 RepID=UPI0024743379|nr:MULTISPECIES: DUF6340 family protein [unclassified Parabacteroides]MDH6305714.1 hypothetical protein [Parabacteroides sp. PH5-39]MDH6316786.1 hypothetical protein [Parabacteroides sp. PF5-13]MDH6320427.1 hypothetical protein [Parabacteroides sp. PH5-13]MDH6324157.1 hypothetical protein [Parabacteroides sp. PH5-8]MDH6327972.1 hypothetical protein [Parabacteroides sp. PH5-41]
MRSIVCLFILCLFTACSQMRFIGIETFNPSEITYPSDARTILIVNNAVPQPPESGYEYRLMGVLQDTCKAYADSALFDACKALGKQIAETDFFYDVRLFNENTRTDNSFLEDQKLSQKEVIDLCEETGADAIISFDRLLFDMKKVISNVGGGFYLGVIDVKMNGIVRSYLPSRENPLASVLVSDSIFWAEEADQLKILDHLYLPSPDEALRTAAIHVGEKLYRMFVPHWNRENRWYYTGVSSKWKEAATRMASSKWDEAIERWMAINEKASGWKSKAKSASNLALAYEMNNDLRKALEWATQAYDLYDKNAGSEDKYTQYQGVYKAALIERIRLDKKLTLQFGE